jgi:hypothetical protein
MGVGIVSNLKVRLHRSYDTTQTYHGALSTLYVGNVDEVPYHEITLFAVRPQILHTTQHLEFQTPLGKRAIGTGVKGISLLLPRHM